MDCKTISLIIAIIVGFSEAKVNYTVVAVEKRAFDIGEGPDWDEKQQVLWHVGCNSFTVCRLNVTSGDTECHKMEDLPTLVHPYPNDEDLLVTQRNKMLKLNWKTKTTVLLGEVAPELKGKERFNDGKADAKGRLWMGTVLDSDKGVVEGKGNLYKWENNKFVKQSEGLYLTNGMTWSHNNKKMFVNDSEGRKIYIFDFDLEKGTVSNRKVLVDCRNNTDFTDNDHPDGLTIEESGHLWSASYAGGRIFKVNPETGKVEDSVSIPCPLTTSLSFGGSKLDEIFVTTAYKNFGPDQRPAHPTCGKVHRITANDGSLKGRLMYRPKLSEVKVNYTVVAVEKRANDLGEGPVWDEKQQVLWHVDINAFAVCRLNVTSGDTDCHTLTDLLSLVHPYPNGEDLLVTQRNKMIKLNWKTKKTVLLGEVAPELKGKERFNDGKADAFGRLWMGTILDSDKGVVEGKGNLYKWENNKFVKQSEGFWLTNGMAWSHNNKKMFVNDSHGRKIYVFDFDLKNGTVYNKKVLVDCDNDTAFTINDHPDGLTIDKSGHLWSASYAGGRIFKVNPETGKVEDSVSIPCPLTTSLSFGGSKLDEIFVTTAYKNFGPDQRPAHPTCGKVHRITANDGSLKGDVMYRPKDDKSKYNVVAVEKKAFDLGEGPVWDEKQQVLWHVDINGFAICRLNVTSGDTDCHKLQDLLTLVHPYPNGEDLLVTQKNKMIKLNWKTKKTEFIGEVAPELKGKEWFNDGKADAKGRLWMGTLYTTDKGVVEGKGNLYKWENNKFVKQSEGFYVTNGMTWSHNNKKMFVNDSEGKKIYVFDFDLEKGTVSNRKVLVDCRNNTDFTDDDHPDGLTIEESGHLWSASYKGGRVFKVNPETGKVEDSVSIPCPLTTSLSFGGSKLDEMFVTTAYKSNGPDQRPAHPTCGKVHRITANDGSLEGRVMYRPNSV